MLLVSARCAQIASNDDCTPLSTSCISVSLIAGTTYAVQVDGYGGAAGSVTLALTAQPSNDFFSTYVYVLHYQL